MTKKTNGPRKEKRPLHVLQAHHVLMHTEVNLTLAQPSYDAVKLQKLKSKKLRLKTLIVQLGGETLVMGRHRTRPGLLAQAKQTIMAHNIAKKEAMVA